MDNRARSEESSVEIARELLIDISNSLPEKLINSVPAENIKVEGKTVFSPIKADEANNVLRSKLISLSYKQSPDGATVGMCNGYP